MDFWGFGKNDALIIVHFKGFTFDVLKDSNMISIYQSFMLGSSIPKLIKSIHKCIRLYRPRP